MLVTRSWKIMKLRDVSFVVLKTNVNKLLGESHLHLEIYPDAWHDCQYFLKLLWEEMPLIKSRSWRPQCAFDLVRPFQGKEIPPLQNRRNTVLPTNAPPCTLAHTQGRGSSIKLTVVALRLMTHLLFLTFRQHLPNPLWVGLAGCPVVGTVCGEPLTLSHPIPPMT